MKTYFNRASIKVLLDLIKALPGDHFYGDKEYIYNLKRKSKLTLADFYKLPFTTRDELYSFQANRTKNSQQGSYIMRAKADASGHEMQFPLSFNDYKRMIAFEQYKFEMIGVGKEDICSIVYFPLYHVIPMAEAIMHMGATYIPIDGTLEQVLGKILDYKLTVVFSTPKTISDLIDFIKKTKRKKENNLRLVITTGQKISDFKRFAKLAKQYLGAELVDHIGSTELSGYAIRCREHNQYHFIDRDQVVEIIDLESLMPADEGELVITSLWRRDFPLIRYRTGDYIQLKKRINCRCGVKDPRVFSGVIKRVGGLTKVNGILVSLDEVFEKVKKSLSFQYPVDKILWGKISPPNVFLILDNENANDRIRVYISRLKYKLTLRKKRPIEDHLESFFGITPRMILIDRKDSKRLSDDQYIDIRGQQNKHLPKEVQMTLKKYPD